MQVFRTAEHVNLSHTIRTLGFGMLYPGIENPLDGFQRTVDKVHTLEGVPTRVGAELNKSHARGGGDVRHSVGAFKYYLKVLSLFGAIQSHRLPTICCIPFPHL